MQGKFAVFLLCEVGYRWYGTDRSLGDDTRNKLCQVSRTVVWYVFVHSWVLCRARAGKRLASWVVLHVLEKEGVQDGVIGSWSMSLGRVDSLTPRDGHTGGAHAGNLR